ncbi:hypothetical protein MHTCC0001_24380 [Flavobacteriaceae bacterium MHTCC 0001]
MEFNVGDRVLVIDEDLSGVVKAIKHVTITIETTEGFLLDFEMHELVKQNLGDAIAKSAFSNIDVQQVISEKATPKKKLQQKENRKERSQHVMEVDLHINQLVKSSKGMTSYDMLNLQLQTAKRQLEYAIGKRIQRIVFIHGVGEGVLKLELETLFRRYDNIKYYDANYQKYGLGATEVYIYQN